MTNLQIDQSFNQFFSLISSLIQIDDNEKYFYSGLIALKKFKKGEMLLHAGEICRNIFFVNKGICRTFFVNCKGEENTFHFTLENGFVTDYDSFLNLKPAYFSIQALESVEAVVMTYQTVHDGYKNLREGEKLGRMLAEKYMFIFADKIKSIYTLDPKTRYKNLNLQYPNILQRVPQHYIASYLNITPVHLSRLKGEM